MNLQSTNPGEQPDLVATSIRVIEQHQHANGAFVASPTFSQYHYSWFRDGAFIAEGLDLAGRLDASRRFHEWVSGVVVASGPGMRRAIADARAGRRPSADDYLHCRYSVDGSRSSSDWPTFQLDGPGIWLWSLAHHLRHGGTASAQMRQAIPMVSQYLAATWHVPCSDAWEEFEDHVHTSTLAAIQAGLSAAVALDEAVAADPSVAEALGGIEASLGAGAGAYTKWQGSDAVDASLLWLAAPYRSVPPTEPRFAATLSRIEDELISDGGGVHRYAADTFYGGGAWPVLSSAYARVLLRRAGPGDRERAAATAAWIEAQADEQGWLPEQVATHALAPDRIEEWRALWGDSARPLLWSHAAYLALRAELEAMPGGASGRP